MKRILARTTLAAALALAAAPLAAGEIPADTTDLATIVAAINDNAQRIAVLEEQVRPASPAGTWKVFTLDLLLAGQPGTGATQFTSAIESEGRSGTLTVRGDGTYTLKWSYRRTELRDKAHGSTREGFEPVLTSKSETWTGTWTQPNPGTFVMDNDGEKISLSLAVDGTTVSGRVANTDNFSGMTGQFNVLIVGVKTADPAAP